MSNPQEHKMGTSPGGYRRTLCKAIALLTMLTLLSPTLVSAEDGQPPRPSTTARPNSHARAIKWAGVAVAAAGVSLVALAAADRSVMCVASDSPNGGSTTCSRLFPTGRVAAGSAMAAVGVGLLVWGTKHSSVVVTNRSALVSMRF